LFYLISFFSSRRRHTRSKRDWSSDVCSSDLKNRLVITPVGLSTLYYSNLIFNASANKCGKSVLLCRPANRSAWGPNAYNGTSVPVCSVLVHPTNARDRKSFV